MSTKRKRVSVVCWKRRALSDSKLNVVASLGSSSRRRPKPSPILESPPEPMGRYLPKLVPSLHAQEPTGRRLPKSTPIPQPQKTSSRRLLKPAPTLQPPEEPSKLVIPKNGLANRLHCLLRKQQSEAAVWRHETKMRPKTDPNAVWVILKKCIHVDNASEMFECKKMTEIEQEATTSDQTQSDILVIFRRDTIEQYALEEGKNVKIFSPYLQLSTQKFTSPVTVGPTFLQLM